MCFIFLIIIIITIYKKVVFLKATGDISKVEVIKKESIVYSKEEINSASNEVLKYFSKSCRGCTLLTLEYIGDENNSDYIDWASRNNKDEVIVFISSFYVDSSGIDTTLNQDYVYEGYNWIFVRNKDENWMHADHGY